VALAFFVLAIAVWRWAAGEGVQKFSPRHLLGGVIGLAAIFFAAVSLVRLAGAFEHIAGGAANDVTFLAPVQQAASALTAEVANVPSSTSTFAFGGSLALALLAVAVWIFGWLRSAGLWHGSITNSTNAPCRRPAFQILGWTFLAWAALRLPNGAPAFVAVIAAFLLLHAVIPSLKQLWRVPSRPKADLPPPTIVPPMVAMLAGFCLLGGAINSRSADFQSAVSRICNPPLFAMATVLSHTERLPTASRRYSRLKICITDAAGPPV
jgi:hypothetical protein